MASEVRRQFGRSMAFGWLALTCGLLTGCWGRTDHEVIVFAALDREFSEPILDDFEAAEKLTVLATFDIESTKTVGLTTRIMGETQRPACDLFWNNEILHTLRLHRAGLLDAYLVPSASDFPAAFRDQDGLWYGLAARARVLLVNTEIVPPDQRPTSLHDLVDPQWKGQVGIAKPQFGTTATHAAVLFSLWGEAEARSFFEAVADHAQIMSGNKGVAAAVGRGQLAFGLTDTDDAIIEIDNGRPVEIVFPDQEPEQMGALLIPNTLCLLKNSPNPEHARRLMVYLLSPEVEARLARGRSAQLPLNTKVEQRSRAFPADQVRWMEVDFQQAAAQWETSQAALREIFARGG